MGSTPHLTNDTFQVMLQDPEQLDGREVSKFHFMVSGQQAAGWGLGAA